MKTSKIFVPVKPVPAARPRVTRWGTYFPKTYTDFRNECYHVLSKLSKQYPCNDSACTINIDFICKRPKNPSNAYPVGDLDNYEKGILDALVHCGLFLRDDIQIIKLSSTKRYQKSKEEFGMMITVTELSDEEASALLD
jgi:Holliday junction resolvase RusA-like endonuclease